jgi:peroxin-5
VKEAASDMMQMMANDPDPKFQNSKFLSFLKKINDGNLTIVNKQLLDKDGASVEVPALEADLENAWKTAV